MAGNTNCSICSLDLGTDERQTIACDSCRTRMHLNERCSGLSASEVRAVILQKRVLMHFCETCRVAFKSVPIMVRKMIAMEEEIKSLKEKISALEKVSEKVQSVPTESIIYEVSERNIRAQNLMVYNVPESSSLILGERVDHDKSKIAEVFTVLGLSQEATLKVVRVGKKVDNTTKPRPIKVICDGSEIVKSALKAGRKLRNSVYKISGDQTKMQREAYKNAKDILSTRKRAGEDNLIVRYRNGLPVVESRQQKNVPAPH